VVLIFELKSRSSTATRIMRRSYQAGLAPPRIRLAVRAYD